jgi:hypothetical protein
VFEFFFSLGLGLGLRLFTESLCDSSGYRKIRKTNICMYIRRIACMQVSTLLILELSRPLHHHDNCWRPVWRGSWIIFNFGPTFAGVRLYVIPNGCAVLVLKVFVDARKER